MWLTGLVAPWHVGSSQTRARTRVPRIGRQILNHCATREAPDFVILCHTFEATNHASYLIKDKAIQTSWFLSTYRILYSLCPKLSPASQNLSLPFCFHPNSHSFGVPYQMHPWGAGPECSCAHVVLSLWARKGAAGKCESEQGGGGYRVSEK